MYLTIDTIDTSKNLWPIPIRSQGICSKRAPVVAHGEQFREQNRHDRWFSGSRQGGGHAIIPDQYRSLILGHIVGARRHILSHGTIGVADLRNIFFGMSRVIPHA
jgi:hypothetical protein